MNKYEQKQADRKAYYEDKAAEAASESERTHERARQLGSVIPFGQPILVGHHSETRDRNFRKRIDKTYQKGAELQQKSDYYAQKAASVGTAGISSDDPSAVDKLKIKLQVMEKDQAFMKAANRVIRSKKSDPDKVTALVALGASEQISTELLQPDFAGRVGFPSYRLSNNNANIRRVKTRIAELEASQARTDVEEAHEGFVYIEDTTENRVMFEFDGKPDETIRAVLKGHAFRWSPSRGAWVRQMTSNALWAAKRVLAELEPLTDKS